MKTSFDLKSGQWRIAWPGRVARHDLVYLTPPQDPMQGIPLGNGDVGVLAWCEGSKLILAVDKCDLWDDGAAEDFQNWSAEQEEFSTALRHACRIVLDFGLPVFDPFYLSDCQGRLSLAEATLKLAVAGPFGAVAVEAFVDHGGGALWCQVRQRLREAVPVDITVERFGSRTFSHWYSLVRRDPRLGLRGTRTAAEGGAVVVAHRLTSGTFAVAAGVADAGRARVRCDRLHAHAGRIAIAAAGRASFALVACVTAPMRSGAVAAARERLADARARGRAAVRQNHRKAWKAFWQRSLMEYGDDYLDTLWHLTMYYANASQRGAYPGRFINGLWAWSRDVQNWNFYFHWNQQQIYWPLNAAGHHDLNDAYLEYRFQSLPLARADAKRLFGTGGAFVSDVTERRGYNSSSERGNYTPVMQIAMDFWRQFRYTGDEAFLRNRALPYLLEAARFAESLFHQAGDGRYHAQEGTAYEGWIPVRDCITVLACARTLFAAALEALEIAGADDPRAPAWREILAHMAPLPTIRAGRGMIARDRGYLRLRRGLFKGRPVPSGQILAVGFDTKLGRVTCSRLLPPRRTGKPGDDLETIVHQLAMSRMPDAPGRGETRCYDGIFPSVEYAAVFPSGPIGLADRGSEEFQAAVNTVELFAPAVMGWDPCPIVMARLGLGRELRQTIAAFAEQWQFYCNGWGHYGPEAGMRADGVLRFAQGLVRDASLPPAEQDRPENKVAMANWPFRHMGMESMSVLACAMNEALLQSHDGVIRVAPAVAETQDARFTLHATGGFVVSAEVRQGQVAWVCVRSRRGGTCRVENPWPRAHLHRDGRRLTWSDQRLVELTLPKGGAVTLAAAPERFRSWTTAPASPAANQGAKTSPNQGAALGLPRMF